MSRQLYKGQMQRLQIVSLLVDKIDVNKTSLLLSLKRVKHLCNVVAQITTPNDQQLEKPLSKDIYGVSNKVVHGEKTEQLFDL